MSRQMTQLFYELLLKKDNVLLSPLSLEMALGIAANGAAGTTMRELEEFLGFEINTINETYRDFLKELKMHTEDSHFRASNSLWIDKQLRLHERYTDRIHEYYSADYHQVNFPSAAANKAMEEWIINETNGHIKPSVESDGPLVILNTLYFRDTWLHQFSKQLNSQEAFYTTPDKTVETTFMHRKIDFHQYSETADYLSSSLYYSSEYRMQFILPKADISLEMILEKYDLNLLFQMDIAPASINFSVPKFKLQNKLELKEVLQEVGIKKAFSDSEADFSLLSEETLYIENIIQEAGISTDENGTEAAAYTKIDIARMAAPVGEVVEFNLNRPFLYGILSKDNHMLFVGAYQKPPEEEKE